MTKTIVDGLIRHVLTTCGGGLVTKGIVSGDELAGAAGAVATLAGIAWSIWSKRKAASNK